MNHREIAQASTDGYLAPNVIRLAAARDALARASRPDPHCRLRVTAWKPQGLIAVMAAELINAAAVRGCGTIRDLRRAGFTDAQIADFGDAAIAAARGRRPDLDRCRA